MTGTRAKPSAITASALLSLAGPCTAARVRVVCVCMPGAWHPHSAAPPTTQGGLEPGGLPGHHLGTCGCEGCHMPSRDLQDGSSLVSRLQG